jgi:hypothetical protein
LLLNSSELNLPNKAVGITNLQYYNLLLINLYPANVEYMVSC